MNVHLTKENAERGNHLCFHYLTDTDNLVWGAEMIAMWRRFLLFQAWALWQGGFLFYAAVVVPTGTDVLGSPITQGFVTQEVTRTLNLIGVVFHLLLAWSLIAERRTPRWRVRIGIGAASAILLIALFVLHPVLDSFLDPVEQIVNRPKVFYRWHAAYMWIAAAQWALALANAWLTLGAWHRWHAVNHPATVFAPISSASADECS